MTVNVLPAAVIVPDLGDGELLDEKLKPTVPFPAPGDPEVTVIQPALLDAVHGHDAVAVTENEPDPAPADLLTDVGLIE